MVLTPWAAETVGRLSAGLPGTAQGVAGKLLANGPRPAAGTLQVGSITPLSLLPPGGWRPGPGPVLPASSQTLDSAEQASVTRS